MKKLLFTLLSLALCNFSFAEEKMEEHPVVILGGGVGALTAGTYLARAGLSPLVLTGPTPGGMLALSPSVQNWPGELEISGLALVDKMQKQAELSGAILRPLVIESVDFSERPFIITTWDGFKRERKKIRANACIIALGAFPNLLNVPGEQRYFGHGVYTCAVCDGSFYKDKVVAIVGSGDTALADAHYLSNIAKKVYILVRKDQFKTVEAVRKQEVLSRSNVEVLFNTTIEEIAGNADKVTHLQLQSGAKEKKKLDVDALFLAIGSTPNTTLFQNQLELDSYGYIKLKNQQETSLAGVWAVGDVVDPEFKQAVTAAGDAAKAALQAQKWLATHPVQSKPQDEKKVAQSEPVKQLTSTAELQQELKKNSDPVLVYFFSTHCPPCRTFTSYYQNWAGVLGNKIRFLKVDTEKARDLTAKYEITSIPTVLAIDPSGHVIYKGRGLKDLAALGARLEEMKNQERIDLSQLR